MSKEITKQLRKVADNLPIIMRETHEYHYIKGSEYLQEYGIGNSDIIDGQKIIPGDMYRVAMPVQVAINHYKKLKKLYEEGGMPLVINYGDACLIVAAEQKINSTTNE